MRTTARFSRLLALAIAVALGSHASGQGTARPPRLYQDSLAELALARARGDATAMVAIAAREGSNETVAQAIVSAGGTIQYRADEVSYLRALVPVDRAAALMQRDDIEGASVDVSAMVPRVFGASDRDSEPGAEPVAADPSQERAASWPPSWTSYPLTNAYSPLKDLGAADLRRQHPTYDGRGITIGHVEAGVDMLLPEFETAYTIDGKEVPKIVDFRAGIDAGHVHGDDARRLLWVPMETEITASGGAFTHADVTYKTPRDGRFRFGLYEGRDLCDTLKRRDPEAPPRIPPATPGPPAPNPKCRFGVLWDEASRDVWVDTNLDRSFADERAMTDFRVRRDVGQIGKDEPDTPEREMTAFAVQTDPARRAVAVLLANGGHATMVAGSAAGSRGKRGRYEGVAPGAQLIVIEYAGACVGGLAESLIDAYRDPRVDLVLFEQNIGIASPYRVGDGRMPATIVTSRLIAKYKKPFVVPGDNTIGLNSVSEHGNPTWGFAVGAYEAKESYRLNDGVLVKHDDNLHHVGSWGPSGDGSIKPDILSPSGYLASTVPIGQARGGVKGLYELPPGYNMGGGTSQATPTMAGALAVLMSAAKQAGVPYDAERIWRAITNSARFIPHLPAHTQGSGLINVAAALDMLRAYGKTPPAIAIASRGPVRTQYGAWLPRPHEGVSLWEREGWRAGQREERTITFTRSSGPREPMTFALSWLGNDGTFTAASSVTLPLGTPVPLVVTVAPTTPGAHSALLTLDHPSIPGYEHRVMTTIVAAQPLAADGKFTFEKKDKIERPGPAVSYFIDIPRGAEAVGLEFTSTGRLSMLDPIARRAYNAAATARSVVLPRPGVWEVGASIANNDGLDLLWVETPDRLAPGVHYTIVTTALGARIAAPPTLSIAPGASQTLQASMTNAFGAFEGGLISLPLGAARRAREKLDAHTMRAFDVQVPPGSPLLFASVTAAAPAEGEIDLYLFDCTGKRCTSAGTAIGHDTAPRLFRANPKAGLWKVVVVASRVAEGGVAFDYADVVADPALGGVTVTDGSRSRDVGAQWSAAANVWLAKPAEDGRQPEALLVVQATPKGGTPIPIGLQRVAIEVKAASDGSR